MLGFSILKGLYGFLMGVLSYLLFFVVWLLYFLGVVGVKDQSRFGLVELYCQFVMVPLGAVAVMGMLGVWWERRRSRFISGRFRTGCAVGLCVVELTLLLWVWVFRHIGESVDFGFWMVGLVNVLLFHLLLAIEGPLLRFFRCRVEA